MPSRAQKSPWWLTAAQASKDVPLLPPRLASINPPIGKSEGLTGANIVITGGQLDQVTKVTIGGVDHTIASGNLTRQSPTQLTIVNLLAVAAGVPTVTVVGSRGSISFPAGTFLTQAGIYYAQWAGAGLTIANGFITSLADVISGNASTTTANSSGPTFVASSINGHPAIQAVKAGSNYLIGSITNYTTTQLTILTTGKLTYTGVSDAHVFLCAGTVAPYMGASSTGNSTYFGYVGVSSDTLSFGPPLNVPTSSAYRFTTLGGAFTEKGRWNNIYTQAAAGAGSIGFDTIYVGGGDGAGSFRADVWEYAFFFLIDHALSAQEESDFSTWHNTVFGFTP